MQNFFQTFNLFRNRTEKISEKAYHARAVFKERFSTKINCIFVLSMVDNLRPRFNLERVPLTVSKKNIFQKSMEKQCYRKEENSSSRWIRTIIVLLSTLLATQLYAKLPFCSLSLISFLIL